MYSFAMRKKSGIYIVPMFTWYQSNPRTHHSRVIYMFCKTPVVRIMYPVRRRVSRVTNPDRPSSDHHSCNSTFNPSLLPNSASCYIYFLTHIHCPPLEILLSIHKPKPTPPGLAIHVTFQMQRRTERLRSTEEAARLTGTM